MVVALYQQVKRTFWQETEFDSFNYTDYCGKNNKTNDKFCEKVAFPCTFWVNFSSQS